MPSPPALTVTDICQVVYGYVGNTMACFVMQSLGCDVAALNTVHFSAFIARKSLSLANSQATTPATGSSKGPARLPRRSATSTRV